MCKLCKKCGLEKELSKFHRDKTRVDGVYPQCKICVKEYGKEYRKTNIKKIRESKKEYRKTNVEKIKEHKKKYYKSNAEKIIDKTKEYRNSFALYNTFAHQISYAEEVRQDPENEQLLQVKCTYCKEWFNPTSQSVITRIMALEGKIKGELKFYCSNGCKKLCPIHWQKKYPKNQKPYVSRPLQKEWADMVKERDEYKCIKCGSTENLIAHHIEGIQWNPIESADIDIGVTLCKKCEGEVHKQEGCRYIDLQCRKEIVL